MLLNKQDLLKSKVLEGRFKIETYFPEYTNYQMTSDSESDVYIVVEFFKNCRLKLILKIYLNTHKKILSN